MESFSNGILCVIFTTCTYVYTVDIQFTCHDTETNVSSSELLNCWETYSKEEGREMGHRPSGTREEGEGGDKIRSICDATGAKVINTCRMRESIG